MSETRVDGRVLGFTLVLSILTGLIFGLAPARLTLQLNLVERLKEGGWSDRSTTTHRLRSALVVAEVALALALLISAGLMMRSFARLQAVPLGFAPENILTMQISLPTSRYGGREQRINFFYQLLERLRAIPSVIDAAAITQPPFFGGHWAVEITVEGGEAAINATRFSAEARAATPHYFATMGIPRLQGREFTEQDRGGDDTLLYFIVSKTFARLFWPNENPIGKRFRPGTNNPWGTVVGVVGDVRDSLLQEEPRPTFYFPYGYIGMQGLVVVVRTMTRPETVVGAVRAEVREIDPELPVYNIRTMDQIISNATAQPRFRAVLLSLFSLAALLLAAVGIYSVMAYLVRQRTREIGIRMALGAERSDILKLVVRQGMILTLMGIALGLAAAFALTRLISSLLFGVSATDPLTFVGLSLGLAAVALLASYIPARRAARIDPLLALRYE